MWKTASTFSQQMHRNGIIFLHVICSVLIYSFHFSYMELLWLASLTSPPVESTLFKKSGVYHRTGSCSLGKYLILNANISNDRCMTIHKMFQ